MSIWRKVGCWLIATVCGATAAVGATPQPLHVTPDAQGGGTGYTWSSPMTLAEARAALTAEGAVLLLKAGTYVLDEGIVLDKPVEIRGGFAGTDDETLAANPYSVLDGQGAVENLVSSSAAGGQTVFSHIEFFNAQKRGFLKTGNGNITFETCRFTGNGPNWDTSYGDGGRAIRGSGSAKLVCTNCTFAGNAIDLNASTYAGKAAVWLTNMKQADFTDCMFATNGIAWSRPLGNDQKICYSAGGSALHLSATPGTVTRCRFVGNRDATMDNYTMTYPSGTLLINGSRCAVSNCLFVANESTCGTAYRLTTEGRGTILVAAGTAAAPVEIVNCTVAYNLSNGGNAGAGLTVYSGVVKVRNSVFYGNRLGAGTEGADVYVRSATANALDLDYSIVTSKDLANLKDVNGTIKMGDNVLTGDPGFVSGLSAIDDLVVPTDISTTIGYKNDDATLATILALDVHAASGSSAMVDNGDPLSDYANEPDPNGERINLGVYGNTPEAHVTLIGQPSVENLVLSFVGDTTQPHLSFDLGGTGDYKATVAIEYSTDGGATYTKFLELVNQVKGAAFGRDLPIAFEPEGSLAVRVTATAYGATDSTDEKSESLEGKVLPPSYGKGGGEGVLHIRAGATGDGSGRDWFNAVPDLASVAALLVNRPQEAWIAGGPYVLARAPGAWSPVASLVVRGGFTGVECAAAARPAGARTTIDGADAFETMTVNNGAGKAVELERFVFTRSLNHGLVKGDTGALTVRDCAFVGNGRTMAADWTGMGGRALRGNGAAKLYCTNCTFAGNVATSQVNSVGQAAVWLTNMTQADFSDCLFVTNGLPWSWPLGADGSALSNPGGGVAIKADNTVMSLSHCRFVANRGAAMNTYGSGYFSATVVASGRPLAATNCLFLANETTAMDSGHLVCPSAGAIFLKHASAASPSEIVNCTFAYNVYATDKSGAGLTLREGQVKIRNSIFFGNRLLPTATQGRDLYIASATANADDIDYTLFTSLENIDVVKTTGAFNFGGGVKAGDPDFVSTSAAVDELLTEVTLPNTTARHFAYRNDGETLAAILALDVHAASGKAPTIDAGDPLSDYANEPSPNGNRVNMGFYGNTSEAHVTETVQPEFDGDVEVTFPYGTTQPHVSFTLGGNGEYNNAQASILWTTNGIDFTEILSLDGLSSGQTVDRDLWIAFAPAGELRIAVSLTAYGAADRVASATESLAGLRYPESYGRGGGAGVVHVRADATGDKSGRDWFNAVTDVGALATSVGADTREIWFAGTNTCASGKVTSKTSVGRAVAVRGGFTGVENAADERKPGAKAVVDGANVGDPLLIENGAGCPLEVERIVFRRGISHGLMKSGAGSVSVHDCDFVSNGQVAGSAADSQYGLGAYLVGTAGTTEMSVSNCTFQGNWFVDGNNRYYASGMGLCVENAKRATVEDSLFLTNGVSLTAKNPATTQMGVYGSAFCARSAPVTMRRCAFRANRGPAYCLIKNYNGTWLYNGGGTVTLMDGSGGSVFENCLWSGNTSEAYQDYYVSDYNNEFSVSNSVNQGALVVRLDDAAKTVAVSNCTFQGNLMDAWESPCAINVMKGAVTVRNSIFTGNVVGQYVREDLADEIAVTGPGSVSVDWTMFDRPAEKCVSAAAGATAEVGEHVTYEKSALLKTSAERIAACVVTNDVTPTGSSVTYHYIRFAPELHATVVPNFDAHLGKGSPALDAGDPDSDCSRERRPNGRCVNLGAYGNTSEAKQTFGGMLIVK